MTRLDVTPPEPIGRRPRHAAATRRRLALETLIALGASAVVAAIVTWPVVRGVGSTVLGVPDSDSAGGIWWLDAVQQHGYRLIGSTLFSEIGYPDGVEQANALNLQWLVPYLPAYLATKAIGAVAAYNLTVLSGFALSGAAMYLLARVLGTSPAVSAWAGLAFLAFPWHVERAVAGHASLVHLECFHLLALALLHLGERRSAGRLALVGGAVAACWLTSGYFGVMALVVVPVAALAAALVSARRRQALVTAGAATGVALGVTAAVYAVSLLGTGGDPSVGLTRSASDLDTYGLRPLELIIPAPGNPTLRRLDPAFWESHKHGSNIQEVSNYLGWITLTLAVVWLLDVLRTGGLSPRHRAATAGAAAVAVVAFLLALPGSVGVGGIRFAGMPSRLLFEVVPVFRVPTRWTVVLFLAVLVLAVLGLQRLYSALRGRPGPAAQAAALGLLGVALAGTWVELRATHPGVHYEPDALPAEYALLAAIPRGALAEYPLVSSDSSTNSEYLLRQRGHGRPLLNGATTGTAAEDIRRALVDPTAPGVAAALAARGVVAIVTRPDTYSRALEVDIPDEAPRLGRGFALVGTTDAGASVWRVVAAPAPALAYLDGPEFSVPTLDSTGRIVQELRGPVGSISVVARRPFRGTLRLVLSAPAGTEHRVAVGGVTTSVGSRPTPVTVPLTLGPGRTEVPLTVTGVTPDEISLTATTPTVRAAGPQRG